MIGILIELIIMCLIFGVLWWAVQRVGKLLPSPALIVMEVIFALAVVLVLLGFLGVGWNFPHHHW